MKCKNCGNLMCWVEKAIESASGWFHEDGRRECYTKCPSCAGQGTVTLSTVAESHTPRAWTR